MKIENWSGWGDKSEWPATGNWKVPIPSAAEQSGPPVTINPLQHPEWDSLLAAHPDSTLFHSAAWARVLHETYGQRPAYIARFGGGQLELLPIMEVCSLWTGRRGVSLPFTDVCPPLGAEGQDPRALYQLALEQGRQRHWRYLECRGGYYDLQGASPSLVYYGHVIELEGGQEALFQRLDGAVRRAIRKAERRLAVEFSNSLESVRSFYALHCRTRRRHGLPPQPLSFFENIARHVLARGHGFVVTVSFQGRSVAAGVFFHHGRQALYKFGASDYAFQHLRPNNLVMWEAIKSCAAKGFARLHLGRTSLSNEGLRRFKLGFGAQEERIAYYKYDFVERRFVTDVDRAEGWFKRVFRLMPPWLLGRAGQALYPHWS